MGTLGDRAVLTQEAALHCLPQIKADCLRKPKIAEILHKP